MWYVSLNITLYLFMFFIFVESLLAESFISNRFSLHILLKLWKRPEPLMQSLPLSHYHISSTKTETAYTHKEVRSTSVNLPKLNSFLYFVLCVLMTLITSNPLHCEDPYIQTPYAKNTEWLPDCVWNFKNNHYECARISLNFSVIHNSMYVGNQSELHHTSGISTP